MCMPLDLDPVKNTETKKENEKDENKWNRYFLFF